MKQSSKLIGQPILLTQIASRPLAKQGAPQTRSAAENPVTKIVSLLKSYATKSYHDCACLASSQLILKKRLAQPDLCQVALSARVEQKSLSNTLLQKNVR